MPEQITLELLQYTASKAKKAGADAVHALSIRSVSTSYLSRSGKPGGRREETRERFRLAISKDGNLAVVEATPQPKDERLITEALALLAAFPAKGTLPKPTATPPALAAPPAVWSPDELQELAQVTETVAYSVDRSIKPEGYGQVRETRQTVQLATADGWAGSFETLLYEIEAQAVAEQNGRRATGTASAAGSNRRGLLDAAKVGMLAAEQARDRAKATTPISGPLPVVFDGRTAGAQLIFALLGETMVGERGVDLGNPLLTLESQPLLPGGIAGGAFDALGQGTASVSLVRGGKLIGSLNPLAQVEGLPAANLVLTGKSEDPLAGIENGLLAKNVEILAVDRGRDHIAMVLHGQRIEKGQAAEAVKPCLHTGSLSDLLKSIDAVSTATPSGKLVSGFGVYCPSFRASGLTLHTA